jgi:hypothetical protein
MPRVTKSPVVYLALSPAATATALGVRPEVIKKAIESGALKVYRSGTKSRCLVSDIEALVRSWPAPVSKKRKASPNG